MRQGSVLPAAIVRRLGLKLEGYDGDPITVIISHDCDLVSAPDDEPFIEVVLGRPIASPQSGCTHAQSTSRLHIEYRCEDTSTSPMELLAVNKGSIRKVELAGVDPDVRYTLSDDGLEILQAWLGARYRRASFPDVLIERLKPMRERLAKVGKKSPSGIVGLWMDFEPTNDELPEDIPYELSIYIVYSTRVPNAQAPAEEAAKQLKADFETRFKKAHAWQLIELRRCDALSETEFTLLDLLRTSQWRLEHISLRESPQGDFI